MTAQINYFLNKASEVEFTQFFNSENNEFWFFLESSIDRVNYIKKIFDNAVKFEAWYNDHLIGVLAFYSNDKKYLMAYISAISVIKSFQGMGVSSQLMKRCICYLENNGMFLINLQVLKSNFRAIKLYEKFGFKTTEEGNSVIKMTLHLKEF